MTYDEETKVQMRMLRRVRDLIDRAAALRGKNRTEFMTDAAYREAQNVLLDQRIFFLGDESWAKFIAEQRDLIRLLGRLGAGRADQ